MFAYSVFVRRNRLFPSMFVGVFVKGILIKCQENNVWKYKYKRGRDFSTFNELILLQNPFSFFH